MAIAAGTHGKPWWPACGLICLLFMTSVWTACQKTTSGVTTFPVSGEAFYHEQPATGAKVLLFPDSQQSRAKRTPIPQAVVDEHGAFRIGCFGRDDGAPAGEYRVAIVWRDQASPDTPHLEMPPDKLKGRYRDPRTSGLTATVVEGENELPPFQLQ